MDTSTHTKNIIKSNSKLTKLAEINNEYAKVTLSLL